MLSLKSFKTNENIFVRKKTTKQPNKTYHQKIASTEEKKIKRLKDRTSINMLKTKKFYWCKFSTLNLKYSKKKLYYLFSFSVFGKFYPSTTRIFIYTNISQTFIHKQHLEGKN